jgi:hypothetical protein
MHRSSDSVSGAKSKKTVNKRNLADAIDSFVADHKVRLPLLLTATLFVSSSNPSPERIAERVGRVAA